MKGWIELKNNKKILFCGTLKSPFILEDLELLKTYYNNIDVINLDIIQEKREGFIYFFIDLLKSGIYKIQNADIIYIWFAIYHALPFILLSKILKKRSILWIGGWEVANFKEIGYGNQLNIFHGVVTRWCIRNADDVIIPSNSYKKIILELVPEANVTIIPNAVSDDLFNCQLPDKTNDVVTALFTLKFTKILKGIPVFEKTSSLVPYPCKVYEGIPHEELMNIFRKSKVYCQLSYTESFGVTNLEAMACGCVPVVSDRDSMPEIIGDSGIVVPYGNEYATANAIHLAMKMDGNIARERAKLYSMSNKLKLLTDLIDNDDLISVVIPSYNSAKWLPETISSIRNQSHKNIEIIVVDDCSTDNTENIIKSMNDIVYIKNDVNSGECISSRRGFDIARGKYICRLSSDDMYANADKLKHQMIKMNETGADWSYNSINCTGETIDRSITTETYWMILPTRYGHRILQSIDNYILLFPRIAFIRLFFGNPINSSTLMFRKSSYHKNDKWSDKHRTDCDGLLLFNLLLRGTKGIAIREIGSFYRTHPNQMSYNPLYIKEMISIRKEIINKVYNGNYPLWLKLCMKIVEVIKK